MDDGTAYQLLADGFGRLPREARRVREYLVGDGILPRATTGPRGFVDLGVPEQTTLAIALAGTDRAVHAPTAARVYPGLAAHLSERRRNLVEEARQAPESDEILRRLRRFADWLPVPPVLAELRDTEGHTLSDAVARFIREHGTAEGRGRLAGTFELQIFRDYPYARLLVDDVRSGEQYEVVYVPKSFATMPATLVDGLHRRGAKYACILESDFFALLGEANEEFEKKTAVAPRPDRRKRVSQAVAHPATKSHRRQNKEGAAGGQPTADLHDSPLTSEVRAACPRSASPRPPAG